MPSIDRLFVMSPRLRMGLALVAGGLLPLSMAPLNLWWLALISPLTLCLILYQQNLKTTSWLSFLFGIGLFGVGASWVFVSIHEFGNASLVLALTLTGLFVTLLSAIFTLPFALLSTCGGHSTLQYGTAFVCLWVLGEWLRSWLFTGFPWLFIGYSQLPTPLSGWAPIGGIFLVSALTVATATLLAQACLPRSFRTRCVSLGLAMALFCSGDLVDQRQFHQPISDPVKVALIQPDIPQERKWDRSFLPETLHRLTTLTPEDESVKWVFWPEAAIPLLYQTAEPLLQQLNEVFSSREQSLITGVLYDQYDDPASAATIYNSLIGLGGASGTYFKTRLVPFGEYVPMEQWLRGLFDFFDLPTSIITAGRSGQSALAIGNLQIASAICYEIVYPDLVARNSRQSAVLLTVSNDAWFGHSWGPLQHLQMAQMRAKETARFVVRATNNGVSAIIAPDGSISARSRQFQQQTLTGSVTPVSGSTPFMIAGSTPTIASCALLLMAFMLRSAAKPLTRSQARSASE